MGEEIFFALCVLDVSLGSKLSGRNTSFMANSGLRDKVSGQSGPSDFFSHDELFEIQERALVKEADFLES